MKNRMFINTLIIGIIILFIVLAVIPNFNAKTVAISNQNFVSNCTYSGIESIQNLIWDNGMYYSGLVAAQYDKINDFDCFQADDFYFNETTYVNGVHWIGGYWGGDPEPFDWCISFYVDDGSGEFPDGLPYNPSFAGPFCFTDEEIEKEELEPVYLEMWVDLPKIIKFDAYEKYWISIWGVGSIFPICGWGFHNTTLLNPAVWGSDNLGYPFWTPGKIELGFNHDMCYQLISPPNSPPEAPSIFGPSSGKAGKQISFIFHSIDPYGDDVMYIIDWGDGTTFNSGYYPTCQPVKVSHVWEEIEDYIIKAMAVDEWGAESDWSYFDIEIPRTRAISSLFTRLIEQYPLLEVLLRRMNLLK